MKHFIFRIFVGMMMLFTWIGMTHAAEIVSVTPFGVIVQRGDTLSQIAKHFDTTWKVLQKINGIKNPHLIYPNDVNKIYEVGHTGDRAK